MTTTTTNVKFVTDRHIEICNSARSLIEKKGRDYNRQEQQNNNGNGDTLANMRIAKMIGLADSCCQSTLIRLFDKMMRLKSLTMSKEPAAIKTESVHDTIVDAINYLVYLDIFYEEERLKK